MSISKIIERKLSAEWIFDKAWPIVWMITGGSVTSIYAGTMEIFEKYKTPSFIALFFIGGFLSAGLYYLLNKIRIQNSKLRSAELSISKSQTNPLQTQFDRCIINLSDFYDPFYIGHIGKTFTNCRIQGPGLLYVPNSQLFKCTLKDCQIVIVKTDQPMKGVTLLSHASITDCTICNCTFLLSRKDYESLTAFHKNVPIISE